MNTVLATGTITITRRPKGEAPRWVREAWIGLTLPCHSYMGYPEGGLDQGVLTQAPVRRNDYGFSAPQAEAIAALETSGRRRAAKWWRDHGFPQGGQCFGFSEECVDPKSVKGVQRQVIRPYESLDRCGTADRD